MVGRALDRKVVRDLVLWRGQIVAIALIIACGIAVFTAMQSVYESLYLTLSNYYARYHAADVYAPLVRAPDTVKPRLATVPGVSAVLTRTVEDVLVDLPGRIEPATLRLIGIPDDGSSSINGLALRRGFMVQPNDSRQIVVSESFADANQLAVGNGIVAILNGRRQNFSIVGLALSPEYVYEIRGAADIWPDARHFGVAWMSNSSLATAFDMRGGFNDVLLTLAPAASVPDVLQRVDAILAPYGGTGAFSKEDQVSNRFLSDELSQLRVQAILIPVIFLGVAAFLLNVALARLIAEQRGQIAILRAFGYTKSAIVGHYLKATFLVVVLGVGAGTVAGAWLGWRLTIIYTHFFHFPLLRYQLGPPTVIAAFGIASAAALSGVLAAVLASVRQSPAEAMRPPMPASFHATFVEKAGLQSMLGPVQRMLLRNIERRPIISAITAGAVACAVAIMIVGRSGYDSIELMVRLQFHRATVEDASIAFTKPLSSSAEYDLRSIPGILQVEPYRAVAVRISNGRYSKRVVMLGILPNAQLRRAVDETGNATAVPPGLMLTEALREELHARLGAPVTVQVLEGDRRILIIPVERSVGEILGLNAYVPYDFLHKALGEDSVLSGAFVTVDKRRLNDFDLAVKNIPAIASVSYREASLQQFRKTIGEGMGISIAFLIAFGSIIACGAVYNAGRIALSERARELSTLRILGYTRRETAAILLGEQAIITTLGVPLGFALGRLFNAGLEPFYRSESYRVPITVGDSTYAFATVIIALAAMLSALLIARQVWRLDLIAVLKSGEG